MDEKRFDEITSGIKHLNKPNKFMLQSMSNPAFWVLDNLGKDLFDNQIEIITALCDLSVQNISILQARGAGKCITGDSIIFTDLGMIELGSLNNKCKVESTESLELSLYSKDGEVKTSHFYNDGVRDTNFIQTSQGYEIEGTDDHPIYVLDSDGELKFKKLSDVLEDDYVCIQRGQDYFSKSNAKIDFKISLRTNATRFNVPKVISKDFARFLGFLVAEGCMTLTGGAFNFTNKDLSVLDDYRHLLKTLFGITKYPESSKDNKTISIQTNSVHVKTFLNKCGVSSVISKDKEIPWTVLQSTKDCVVEFLRSLFESEASVYNKQIEFSTASEKLSKQLQIVLSNFGIICSRKTMFKCATNGSKIKRKYFRLSIRGNNIDLFKRHIGFISKRKSDKLNIVCYTTRNTNVDVVPFVNSILLNFYHNNKNMQCNSHNHSGISLIGKHNWDTIRSLKDGARKNLSTTALVNVNSKLKDQKIKEILKYNFFFDTVEIKTRRRSQVYDFVVPKHHNFNSNSFISHNTFAVAMGLMKLCTDNRDFSVGIFAPKAKQAERIIDEITNKIATKKTLVYDMIDHKTSIKARMRFKNGSEIYALSADETSQQEGYHFNMIIVDEAHRVTDTAMTQRVAPMIGTLKYAKTVKLGIAIGKNHFFRSCNSPSYKVFVRDWTNSPALLTAGSIFYKGKELPKIVVDRLPISIKQKLFPDRPDLHYESTEGYTELDYFTQYSMEWSDDIFLELNKENQEKLFSGTHDILNAARPAYNETYFFGLDTAPGSLTGNKDLDYTVLSIWRKLSNNVKEKVKCFSGDTKIKLLDGTTKTIKELSELDSLDDIWVYSIDKKNNIVPGKVSKAWKTGTEETVKVTLDNNESFICTPDHKVMLRDGSYKEASDLKENDSLMPIYSDISKKGHLKKGLTGYEILYNPNTETWEYTHKLVAENIYGNSVWPNVTHHKNFNKLNNNPRNLTVLPFKDHVKLHKQLSSCSEIRKKATASRNKWLQTWTDLYRVKFGNKISKGLAQYHKTNGFKENCKKVGKASLAGRTKEQLDIFHGKGKKRSKEFCEKIRNAALGRKHSNKTKKYLSDLRKSQHAERRILSHKNWKISLILRSKSLNLIDKYGVTFITDFLKSHTVKDSCKLFRCGNKTIWKLKIRLNLIKSISEMGKRLIRKNHRVVSVEKNLKQDVYDITVDKHHNFALACGVFVHNCYSWQGNVVDQKAEIKQIITEIFPCIFGLADYSNIAQGTIEEWQKEGIAIEGVLFGSSEPLSKKNKKNAMFDQFRLELENDRVKFPSLDTMNKDKAFKLSYNEWKNIERHIKLGINAQIEAPSGLHDDHPCADVLAVWAMDRMDQFKIAKRHSYRIPKPMLNEVSRIYNKHLNVGKRKENRYLK